MRDLDFSERKFGEVLILGGPYAFVYLVEDVLIDTGTAFWGKKISEYLKEKGLKLRLVLLTHSHYDHVGGLPYILKSQNPQIFAHPYFEKVLSSEKGFEIDKRT
jgi:Predicted hydrolase (metallo-beta-lactamase superfamily)